MSRTEDEVNKYYVYFFRDLNYIGNDFDEILFMV